MAVVGATACHPRNGLLWGLDKLFDGLDVFRDPTGYK